ncbi:HAD-IC family P-type ATPase [Actinotalea sp. K2]|uniref:cation-translocating P-type ATPase n=1 Tax=Actinotalea sp. K2 TaxID=2939438 RepID=UPI0020178849|nr:HAD-IC family P-type ATPase [Actinotalea sp. K2]MCL3859667.1 HAD-IC family P-type ATPase [Actinotalea sp. K2]
MDQPKSAHSRTVGEVLAELDTTPEGLSGEEAQRRLGSAGPNRLPDARRENLLRRILKHFDDILIYILLVAVVVTALLGEWVDSGVILGVVVIIAAIGFIQEGKAESALEGIRAMLTPEAQARRDGHWATIDAQDLVPGDVVRLRSGDRVPADLRVIDATNLSIEESALTGESMPTDKGPDPAEEDAGLGDRPSMAFSSSLVTSGRGVGVVTGTGVHTEIGRISTLTSEVQTLATPLTRSMNRFGKQLSVAIGVLAGVVFLIGVLVHGDPAPDMLIAAISLAVAAVPEGLPAVLTITFAIGAQRMARRKAITRRLDAVETLGSITVICSDKTGTLTRNEMTVRSVQTTRGRYDVTGTGYAPEGEVQHEGQPVPDDRHDLVAVLEAMAVANDSEVFLDGDRWVLNGAPTEGALQTLALKSGFDASGYSRRAEVPFESEHKLMATLASGPGSGSVVLVKGAPDHLLDRCDTELSEDGQEHPLDRAWWEERIAEMTSGGSRVLAAARRDAADDDDSLALEDLDGGLVLLGVVGIVDPPRPEAVEAIAACHRAGITVKMITGDHPSTALAIAREMGIVDDSVGQDAAVTGRQLEAASDEELATLARDHHVFARTSPEHKLRLVTALQAAGQVVAMTGDGVNDAPALKRADVGVAMGVKGTEATKEAAEIVLADDNFVTIERAVEEGRTIYDNLRKSILFILPTNAAQALVIVAAVLLAFTLPLTPTQILWINMVTAVTLALTLAFEKAEPGIMERPPRDPDTPILDAYSVGRIAFVALLIAGATITAFRFVHAGTGDLEVARTVAVSTLALTQVCYLFNSRYLVAASYLPSRLVGNPVVWWGVGAMIALQLGLVYLPFMNTLFRTAPLTPQQWVLPVLAGLAVFVLVEVEKAVFRQVQRTRERRAGP